MTETWIADEYATLQNSIEHLNGVKWFDAPLPRRWHRCTPQTRGWATLNLIERCACGATRLNHGPDWIGRNER